MVTSFQNLPTEFAAKLTRETRIVDAAISRRTRHDSPLGLFIGRAGVVTIGKFVRIDATGTV